MMLINYFIIEHKFFKTNTKNKCIFARGYDKNYSFINKMYNKYKTNIIVFIIFCSF